MCSDFNLHHFTYYPFLRASNLVRTGSSDMGNLELQKSVYISAGKLLEMLSSYCFLHVHPCLPSSIQSVHKSVPTQMDELQLVHDVRTLAGPVAYIYHNCSNRCRFNYT